MLEGQYYTEYDEEDVELQYERYLDIKLVDNDTVKLIIRNREYNETEKVYAGEMAIISIKELEEFCNSMPGLYPELPEKMIKEKKFFDDNGIFSENEIREFMKLEYIPGQFYDIGIGAGGANYGEVSIYIPNGIATKLDKNMFDKYKERIVEISIPESVKSIDRETFANCPNLKKVSINEKIAGFGDIFELFENCPKLDNIFIVSQNAEEYYDKFIEIKRKTHDISEIAETVSDRTFSNMSKVASEISKEMKEEKELDMENR